jgi:hypothetical protein
MSVVVAGRSLVVYNTDDGDAMARTAVELTFQPAYGDHDVPTRLAGVIMGGVHCQGTLSITNGLAPATFVSDSKQAIWS